MRVAIDARCLSEHHTSNRIYWAELVKALGDRNDIELLLMSNAPIPADDVPASAEVIVEPTGSRWFSFWTLPKLADKHKADVVHVQYTVSPRFRRPVVTMVHDVSYFIEPGWFGRKDRLLLRATVPAACRRAQRVVVPSETAKEELLRFIPVKQEKVVVTPHGVPHQVLTEPDETANQKLEDLAHGRPFVLLVGGASPRKNLPGAIKAVEEARKQLPDLQLLVTGKLSLEPRPAWVLTPGPLDEAVLRAAYRQAHALLHPSYHEGFGLTVLEAMAVGCPVVTSNRGALPEVAADGALLYDPTDAEGMANGLVQLKDPAFRRAQIERGHARSQIYRWEVTAQRTVDAYREAVRVF